MEESHRDPVEELFEYVNKSESFRASEELEKDSVDQEYKSIYLALISLGFPPVGDLTTLSKEDLGRTNVCIKALLLRIQAETAAKKQADELIFNFEKNEKKYKEVELRLSDKEKEIERLKALVKTVELKAKQEKEKLILERDELLKRFTNIQSQQVLYQNEIRRREKEIAKLQEHLSFKNISSGTMELSATLSSPLICNKSSGDSLLIMIAKGYENTVQELKAELKAYQNLYRNMQDEIEVIVSLRKTEVRPEIRKITSSLYNLPVDASADRILAIFKENLAKLKNFMDETDILKARHNVEGETKSKVMEILENYTEMVKSQAASMKKTCSVSQKTLGDHEFENMWKIVANNRRVLEENRRLIVPFLEQCRTRRRGKSGRKEELRTQLFLQRTMDKALASLYR